MYFFYIIIYTEYNKAIANLFIVGNNINKMDKIKKEANESNKQLLASLSKIYGDISKNMNQSYLTGKKEAYEEVLYWLMYHCGDNKFIPPSSFYNMMKEKQIKTKIAMSYNEEESDFKVNSETKKKIHRGMNSNYTTDNNNNMNDTFPLSVSALLNNGTNFNHENTGACNSDDDEMTQIGNINYTFNPLKKKK